MTYITNFICIILILIIVFSTLGVLYNSLICSFYSIKCIFILFQDIQVICDKQDSELEKLDRKINYDNYNNLFKFSLNRSLKFMLVQLFFLFISYLIIH